MNVEECDIFDADIPIRKETAPVDSDGSVSESNGEYDACPVIEAVISVPKLR